MYCITKCIVRGNQSRVKNADLRHPSCTVVMYRRKSAAPVHNVLDLGLARRQTVSHCLHHVTVWGGREELGFKIIS